MVLKVSELFEINEALSKLLSQDKEYPINIGYDIYRVKKNLDDIESYVVNRLCMVLDNERMSKNELTNEEMLVYDTVMNSDVEIETFKIEKEKLFDNNNVKLTVKEVGLIDRLFEQKIEKQ